MTHLTLVEQQISFYSDDEDYIPLYVDVDEESYIYYIRNYVAQTEFLLLSQNLMMSLDERHRTVTGVYLTPYFSVLKQFEQEIAHYVVNNSLLAHFHQLFGCSVSRFINEL